jgi:hypothetical protein
MVYFLQRFTLKFSYCMTYDELFLSPEKRLPTFRKLFNYVWWKRVTKVSETTFTELLLQTEEGQKK